MTRFRDGQVCEAYAEFGELCSEGQGVSPNEIEAFKWYKLAAENGHKNAQHVLAMRYLTGTGISENIDDALMWLTRFYDGVVVDAYAELGDIFAEGKLVSRNEHEAFKWYKLAADYGHVDSQRAVAQGYLSGSGVEKNLDEALVWIKKSYEDSEKKWELGQDFFELGAAFERGRPDRALTYSEFYDANAGQDIYQAAKWYKMALKYDRKQALIGLGRIKEAQGNYRAALKYYKEFGRSGEAEERIWDIYKKRPWMIFTDWTASKVVAGKVGIGVVIVFIVLLLVSANTDSWRSGRL